MSADRLIQLHEGFRPSERRSRLEDRPDELAERTRGSLVVIAGEHADDRPGLTGHLLVERQISFHTHHDERQGTGLLHGSDGIVH